MAKSKLIISCKTLLGNQLVTFKVQDPCVSPLSRVLKQLIKNLYAPKVRFIVLSTLVQLLLHRLEILVILFNT